jgi:hypothetical protein
LTLLALAERRRNARWLGARTDRADQCACQVFAMPTLLFIKDGKIRQRAEGAMLAPKIKDLAEHIFFDGVHPPPLVCVECYYFLGRRTKPEGAKQACARRAASRTHPP